MVDARAVSQTSIDLIPGAIRLSFPKDVEGAKAVIQEAKTNGLLQELSFTTTMSLPC